MGANPAFFELMAQVLPVVALAGAFTSRDPDRGPHVTGYFLSGLMILVIGEFVTLAVVGGALPNNAVTLGVVTASGIMGTSALIVWVIVNQLSTLPSDEPLRPMHFSFGKQIGLMLSLYLLGWALVTAAGRAQ